MLSGHTVATCTATTNRWSAPASQGLLGGRWDRGLDSTGLGTTRALVERTNVSSIHVALSWIREWEEQHARRPERSVGAPGSRKEVSRRTIVALTAKFVGGASLSRVAGARVGSRRGPGSRLSLPPRPLKSAPNQVRPCAGRRCLRCRRPRCWCDHPGRNLPPARSPLGAPHDTSRGWGVRGRAAGSSPANARDLTPFRVSATSVLATVH